MKKRPLKTALLTNFIPPYRVSLFTALQKEIGDLRILLSVPMETNRQWPVEWGDLDVLIQKTFTVTRTWRHPNGFSEKLFVHFPYDTIPSLIQYRPDVVITVELGFRTIQAILFKLIFKNTRLIFWEAISEHTEKGRGRLVEKLRSVLLRYADAVWVNGKSGEDYIISLGVDIQKIFRVPYTIDDDVFACERRSSIYQNLQLLIIGQLVERKGVFPFLDQLDIWTGKNANQELTVIVVGDGPLREQILDRPLPSNLHLKWIKNINYKELPQIYSQSDLFAFPTLADEWGIVVNEAMAAGLPVIGSLYSQAVTEMVIDHQTGWLFHPDQTGEVQEVLAQALATPREDLIKMGERGKQRVKAFGVQTAVQQMLRSIAFVINNIERRQG